jgi:hypothetical protein
VPDRTRAGRASANDHQTQRPNDHDHDPCHNGITAGHGSIAELAPFRSMTAVNAIESTRWPEVITRATGRRGGFSREVDLRGQPAPRPRASRSWTSHPSIPLRGSSCDGHWLP